MKDLQAILRIGELKRLAKKVVETDNQRIKEMYKPVKRNWKTFLLTPPKKRHITFNF